MAVDAVTGVPGDVVVDLLGQGAQTPVEVFQQRESAPPPVVQEAPDLSKKDLERLTENLNDLMDSVNVSARFSVHEITKDIMVRVYNSKTNETIREIPPKKIVDMVAKMMELVGLLMDERA